MTVNLNIVEKCVSCLNIKESYDLARRMEQEKTNPVLGYRTAGSLAERKTGDMLLEEMKKAGLTQVEKDKIRVDAWEFKKAVMRCHDREGTCREIQLGAYQTDFKTNGFQRFDLVYLGKGTADEYKDIDVKGKLVLIEINQREEWWINYPVYQAHLKGAAALIAVQSRGYAQIYDSYFEGFQDDNAAVAMIIGIARALLRGGYKPRHTIVVCALAAEEWGISDTKYDWSTGAYRQVFEARSEWQGHVIADLNFELPAHAHSTRDAVRCTYEYADFVRSFVDAVQMPEGIYPEGMTTLYPIETWSDDFTMAISGIPSMVNDFSGGPFMENYYHSQYDNQDVYEEEVYRFHHEFYLKLLLAIDSLALPPMDFGRVLDQSIKTLDTDLCMQTGADRTLLLKKTEEAKKAAAILAEQVRRFNSLPEEKRDWKKADAITEKLLGVFRKSQDYLVRLDWDDNVIFPQQAVQNNLYALKKAMGYLEKGEVAPALEAFYSIDNNCYAFQFEREVFYHFTEYILKQSPDRLMWGKGRIIHHENLYDLVESLKEKKPGDSLEAEKQSLKEAWERQKRYYEKLMDEVIDYADRHKLMISLETHNPANVSMYEKFGFKLYGIVQKKGFDLKQYCMIKQA